MIRFLRFLVMLVAAVAAKALQAGSALKPEQQSASNRNGPTKVTVASPRG
jgi:hypothetical protein